MSGELRASAEPSIELQAKLVLTERDLERDLCLSSSSELRQLGCCSCCSCCIRAEAGPRDSSDLPHKLLETLGELDTETEKHLGKFFCLIYKVKY